MASWSLKGKWLEACNCDTGCPCNFSGFPTHGKCEGNVGFYIEEGERDGVSLVGVKVAMTAAWPGAIHEGNGTGVMFIDSDATEEQRAALLPILTAEDGGMPFEIFKAVLSDIKGPYFETVEFEDKGVESSIKVGDKLQINLTGLKNPVTGDAHEAHTVLPEGFIWKDGNVTTSSRNISNSEVKFDHTGNSGYYADFEWTNTAAPEKVAGTKF
jgi:hypothetical protein